MLKAFVFFSVLILEAWILLFIYAGTKVLNILYFIFMVNYRKVSIK